MKLFKSKKGQLLLYFLVVMGVGALALTVFLQHRITRIKLVQRGVVINALIAECGANIADIQEKLYSGDEEKPWVTIALRNKSLIGFMKVRHRTFLFSSKKIMEWVEFQKILESAGMLADTGAPPEVEYTYLRDLLDTQKKMISWLNSAKGQDNNFNY